MWCRMATLNWYWSRNSTTVSISAQFFHYWFYNFNIESDTFKHQKSLFFPSVCFRYWISGRTLVMRNKCFVVSPTTMSFWKVDLINVIFELCARIGVLISRNKKISLYTIILDISPAAMKMSPTINDYLLPAFVLTLRHARCPMHVTHTICAIFVPFGCFTNAKKKYRIPTHNTKQRRNDIERHAQEEDWLGHFNIQNRLPQ